MEEKKRFPHLVAIHCLPDTPMMGKNMSVGCGCNAGQDAGFPGSTRDPKPNS